MATNGKLYLVFLSDLQEYQWWMSDKSCYAFTIDSEIVFNQWDLK